MENCTKYGIERKRISCQPKDNLRVSGSEILLVGMTGLVKPKVLCDRKCAKSSVDINYLNGNSSVSARLGIKPRPNT